MTQVHLPVIAHSIRHTNGNGNGQQQHQQKQQQEQQHDSKLNGHGQGGHTNYGASSPVKTGYGTSYHHVPMQYPGQFTVMDDSEDHPGMRKNSGFLQPMKHLSGRAPSLNAGNLWPVL